MTTKTNIAIAPDKCKGCLNCQLICSFAHEGTFNISKSRISISQGKIVFLESCIKGCQLCSDYCAFGALRSRS